MDGSFLPNLLAYSAQIALVVGIGTLAAGVLRIDAAAVRYTYWRLLLVLCLVLPWLQGRQSPPAGAAASTITTVESTALFVTGSTAADAGADWMSVLGALIVVGAMLRALWLAAGLLRLRRLRTAGEQARPGEAHEDLQRALGTDAEIRYVAEIRQPVTFGARRPVVLLPDSLRDRGWHIQRAVITHELFHVQRRDWLWTLTEEVVRTVVWFHPAIWWLVSRVQLAREEAVDELVVLATGGRRTYLEALLAFADEAPLARAAAFARRRHLYRRMMLISKEAVMSAKRVVLTSALMALVVAAGSWYAVGAFPMLQAQEPQGVLNAPGPVELRAKAITPENPIPRRIYAAPIFYPAEAVGTGTYGTVTLRVVLNEIGRVAELRRMGAALSDPAPAIADAFVRAAAAGVRLWIFDAPADGPLAFDATLRFGAEQEATLLTMGNVLAFNPGAGARGRGPGQAVRGYVDAITVDGRGGAPGVVEGAGGAAGRSGGAFGAASAPPPPPPPPPPPRSSASTNAIRVGGAIRQPNKITHVNPVYPPDARDARVQGIVIIEALIDAAGRVSEARVLRSIPMLDQAALDAVRQWEFTPTLLNGAPVPVIMTVTALAG
jgi:TonB family protein